MDALATTGIGSLPFTDPHEACRFVFEAGLDLPFWPQLPRRDFRELMVPQFAEGLPCLTISPDDRRIWLDLSDPNRKAEELAAFYERYLADDLELGRLSPDHAAGLAGFLENLASTGQHRRQLKGHVTGPMTMGLGLNDQEQRPVAYDADLFDCVVKLVELKARWQATQLRNHGDRVVIFLDEPVLAAFGSSAYLSLKDEHVIQAIDQVTEPLRAEGTVVGVHCCGNTDWAMFMKSQVDLISFDAFRYAPSLALYGEALNEFLARGGLLAWGLVPTLDLAGTASVEEMAQVWDDSLNTLASKGIDPSRIANQSMLTPSCGAGSLSVEAVRNVFDQLTELHHRLARGRDEQKTTC